MANKLPAEKLVDITNAIIAKMIMSSSFDELHEQDLVQEDKDTILKLLHKHATRQYPNNDYYAYDLKDVVESSHVNHGH